MTKNYELMVIVSPRLNKEEADAVNENVLNLVRNSGGNVIKTDPWGRKMLAYPIKKMQEGYYYVNYFDMESTSVKAIKAQMNITEDILRHMFVVRES